MGEIDYWFVKHMYILGVVGITVAVVQVRWQTMHASISCVFKDRPWHSVPYGQ